MYRVKIFSEVQTDVLQQSINDWLMHNKDAVVHSSNWSVVKTGLGSNEYSFYLLYTSASEQEEELKEMAAVVKQEQSIDVQQMNPEILKPSS